MIIAEKAFRVNGSQDKIWGCLTKALLNSMPLEQIDFVDEKRMSAVLRLKMSCLELPLRVNLEISDIVEREILAAKIKATGLRGIIQLSLTVRFSLAGTNNRGCEVSGRLEAEEMSLPVRVLLLWKVKGFARDSLDTVERLLRAWTEIET